MVHAPLTVCGVFRGVVCGMLYVNVITTASRVITSTYVEPRTNCGARMFCPTRSQKPRISPASVSRVVVTCPATPEMTRPLSG